MFGEIRVTEAKALPYERIKDALGPVSADLGPSQLLKGLDVIQTGSGRLGFINSKLSHILEFDEPRKTVNLTVYIDEGRSSYPRSTFGSAVFSAASRVCP